MPLLPEELLKQVQEATAEAKEATRHLHEATKDARQVVKENKKAIAEAIVAEVHAQLDELATATEREMQERVARVIGSLEGAWRDKLGLP